MKSLQAHLLIASPQLLDPNFAQTVILVVQHDANGALGVVLNRPMDTTIAQAWKQVSQKPCFREDPLYFGGPCQGVLIAVHTFESASDVEVLPGLYFTTDAQKLEWLVEQTDGSARFFVGYSGWGDGQLEHELDEASWQTLPARIQHVFDQSSDQQWENVRKDVARATLFAGMNPKIIPIDPSLN
jgi:putative transcriptional regulator